MNTKNKTSIFEYKNFLNSKVDVFLCNQDITKFEGGDCLVNCTGPAFQHASGVAKAIIIAAGKKNLEKEFTRYLDKNQVLNYEEIFETSSFDLKNYKLIYHIASPHFGLSSYGKILRNTILEIIKKAFNSHGGSIKSIVLPFIGTGANGITIDEFLDTFMNALEEFTKNHQLNRPVKIYLVTNFDNFDNLNNLFTIVSNKYAPQLQPATGVVPSVITAQIETKKETEDKNCVICMDKIEKEKILDKCGHSFCTDCIEGYFKEKQTCPICGIIYGITKGTQPNGTMRYQKLNTRLPGYENYGTIQIIYDIPSGIQGPGHPHPKRPYYGTQRTAYLPDNKEGNEIFNLFKKAFDNRLIFTVGQSRTTNHDDMVTWNDIHHKTSPVGGPTGFGYPDPTYLNRVRQELAAKGIV